MDRRPSPQLPTVNMMDESKNLTAKPFTLLVGPQKHKLHFSRGLLSQIPFFHEALIANTTTESAHDGFKMPEFDHRALTDVLYFHHSKTVNEMDSTKKAGNESQGKEVVKARVKAYVTAQKLAIDWIHKDIERQLVLYHQTHEVDPKNLIFLYEADLCDSILYKFLMTELGRSFSKNDFDKLESTLPGFTEMYEVMPREMLWYFLKATDGGYDFEAKNQSRKRAPWLEHTTDFSGTEHKSTYGHA